MKGTAAWSTHSCELSQWKIAYTDKSILTRLYEEKMLKLWILKEVIRFLTKLLGPNHGS